MKRIEKECLKNEKWALENKDKLSHKNINGKKFNALRLVKFFSQQQKLRENMEDILLL